MPGGAACGVRHAGGKSYVNVPHHPAHGIPGRIDQTASDAPSSTFPGLTPSLTLDAAGTVTYRLGVADGPPRDDVVVTVSMPPAFDPGMVRRTRRGLGAGDTWETTLPIERERTGAYWQSGRGYLAAQLDFVRAGRRGRLFTTSSVDAEVAAR